ncbi:hypothetical protein C8J56DRAFT_1159961 [Mycena floridula]|nr:hypothetical protein C8J56DRAFT_1159961 [Mycena floridula]
MSAVAVDPLHDDESALQALTHSFLMIIASEIGDKTFLIAAILAMRHPRLIVFLGAFSSLLVMSLLSAGLGSILPQLIPRKWTQVAAAVLFLVFGAKMFVEGRAMDNGQEKMREEMKEVEEEIQGDDAGHENSIPLEDMEQGMSPGPPRSPPLVKVVSGSSFGDIAEGARNFCSLFLGPVFVQAFILTFLGEWGDRSQIATIALGAAHNVYLVALGTIIGHSLCTALAVVGGKLVSAKISVKYVTLTGGVLFLIFGVIYLYEAFAMDSSTVEELGETIPLSSR